MKKAKQRFSWDYVIETMTASVTDNITKESVTWTLKDLPGDIEKEVACYGLGKVLQDRNSQEPAETKIECMNTTFNQLVQGIWKAKRTGGIHVLPAIIQAIMDKTGATPSQVQKAWRASSDEKKAALRVALGKEVLAIEEARKTQEDVDLDELL